MVQKITGEAPFQVLATNFSISPSQQDYTLQISADGTNYSDLFTVSAGQTKMVTNVANGSYYRMKNNASEVSINWRTQCNDGQGGGGGGSQYILPPATQQTLGGIKVGQGLSVQPDGTLSASGGSVDPTAVQELIDANNTKIEEGDIIAGMAKQLYSPDGVTSEGAFAYRTTAGDEDVSTAPAKLQKVGGNAIYPETEYNDSAVLMRNGEPVEGFDAEFYWGDASGWTAINDVTNYDSLSATTIRIKVAGQSNFYPGAHYKGGSFGSCQWKWDGSSLSVWSNATASTANNWTWNRGTAHFDGTYLIIEVDTNSSPNTILYRNTDDNAGGGTDYYYNKIIPNDVLLGETTYTYDGSDWSETLPQAITSMTINGVDYVPQSGDELVVTRSVYKEGSATYPAPDSFVALGLNSFTKDGSPINLIAAENYRIGNVSIEEDTKSLYQDNDCDIYAIKAITGLENGYVVYHKEGSSVSIAGVADKDIENLDICYSATVHTSTYDVVYPTDDYPYIVFSLRKDDEGTVCVHPRWSGYMDENYEDYTESVLDISSFNTDCPLLSVGNVRNIWDFENSKLIQNIGVSTYSAQAVQDLIDGGKEIGVDFDLDENNIYEVLDEPIVTDITFENDYDANDFSVEYFAQDNDLISAPVYATTWYMNNLVDKLRRINGLVHLENLNGTGSENTLYEADGYLWYWSSNSGSVAEWTNRPDESGFGSTRGYGLIFSHIPDGQTILEAKYQYDNDSDYKAFKMSGGTLVMTNSANTVLSACTVGNSAEMKVRNTSSSYAVRVYVSKHRIGFDIVGILSFRNIWDGNVSGPHFCITDHTNYPYLYNITSDAGIPRWNNKGQIVGKDSNFSTKSLYFNTSGSSSSSRLSVLTNGSNGGPDHFFVPSQSGTQGQILQSNGNAEPTWINWIKAVKITSTDYDALVQAGTTDPNTLYLIDDE